jgi:hypothetical protein
MLHNSHANIDRVTGVALLLPCVMGGDAQESIARVGVGTLVIRDDGLVLIGRRCGRHPHTLKRWVDMKVPKIVELDALAQPPSRPRPPPPARRRFIAV